MKHIERFPIFPVHKTIRVFLLRIKTDEFLAWPAKKERKYNGLKRDFSFEDKPLGPLFQIGPEAYCELSGLNTDS